MGKVKKKRPLVDAKRPNLLEETFPYSMPPRIRLEGPVVEYIDGEPVEFDFGAVKNIAYPDQVLSRLEILFYF